MMNSKSPIIAAGMLILITALSACQKKDDMSGKGPAEKAGAQIDSAAAKAGEELNKAGEKAEQAMQSAAEKTGQMMQEAGKQMEEKAHEKAQDAKK